MIKTEKSVSSHVVDIEKRLGVALRESEVSQSDLSEFDTSDLSARELLQLAWDRAEEELDALHTELRQLRQRHQAEERSLLSRINEKKRLQRELVERAPKVASN